MPCLSPSLLPSVPTPPQDASEEEREHAEKLMEYQNVRGGRVRLASMLQPETEFNHADKVREPGRKGVWFCEGRQAASSVNSIVYVIQAGSRRPSCYV